MTDRTLLQVLDLAFQSRTRFAIVDAPPGSGKTELVITLAATGATLGLRVAVATPRAAQATDLARRLVARFPGTSVELVLGRQQRVPASARAGAVEREAGRWLWARGGTPVTVGTVSKLAIQESFGMIPVDLMLFDEAYQVPFGDYFKLRDSADQFLFVGDPGQLPPLVEIDTEEYSRAVCNPAQPAPAEILRLEPATPVVRLATSRRLLPDTVGVIQPAFYPNHPFSATHRLARRRLRLDPGGGRPADAVLDLVARGRSLAAVLLPPFPGSAPAIDQEAIDLAAEIVERLLARRPANPAGRVLSAGDVCCLDPHNVACSRLRAVLQRGSTTTSAFRVSTPERFQGLETPIAVVRLPGWTGPGDEFSLDPGRLCTLLTRHSHACVVVARQLPPDTGGHAFGHRPLGAVDRAWAGRKAHQAILAELGSIGAVVDG